MMSVQLPKYVKYCFDDRFEQLKALGIADEETKQVDHEKFRHCVSSKMAVDKINRVLGIPPGTLVALKTLEHKLQIIDENAVCGVVDSDGVRTVDFSDVPSLSSVDTPQSSDQPSEPLAFVFDASVGSKADLRAGIGVVWCDLRGIPYYKATRSTMGWKGDDDRFFKALRRIKPDSQTPTKPWGRPYTHVVLWSLSEVPEDMRGWLDGFCSENGVELVELSQVRADWKALLPGIEDVRTKPGWQMFGWAHEQIRGRTCVHTVRCELEDVMDLSRGGVPIRVVAKALGVNPMYVEMALDRESMSETYRECLLRAMDGEDEPEDAGDQDSDSPAETIVTASEPTVDASASEDTASPEDVQPEESVQETVPEEPAQDVPQIVQDTAPVAVPVVEGADGIEDQAPANVRRFTARVPDCPEAISIDQPMMTVSGARSIVETVNRGVAPDMDLWSLAEGGLAIDTYRLSLRYQDGKVRYASGQTTDVVRAIYSKPKEDIIVNRAGRIYIVEGFLTIRLSDFTAVEVPVLSDMPLNSKRWIA